MDAAKDFSPVHHRNMARTAWKGVQNVSKSIRVNLKPPDSIRTVNTGYVHISLASDKSISDTIPCAQTARILVISFGKTKL